MYSRSLGANPDDLKDPIKISIPRYVLCGQGKDEHFEFEVKVSVTSSPLSKSRGWKLCNASSVCKVTQERYFVSHWSYTSLIQSVKH